MLSALFRRDVDEIVGHLQIASPLGVRDSSPCNRRELLIVVELDVPFGDLGPVEIYLFLQLDHGNVVAVKPVSRPRIVQMCSLRIGRLPPRTADLSPLPRVSVLTWAVYFL